MSLLATLQAGLAAVQSRVKQFNNQQFADSTMAALAYMSGASNGIDPSEEQSTAEAIVSIEALRVFKPQSLQAKFSEHVADINKSQVFGMQNCLTEAAKLKDHPEQAASCMEIALVIGSQDPDKGGLNYKAGQKLIHALGLKESDFDLTVLQKK